MTDRFEIASDRLCVVLDALGASIVAVRVKRPDGHWTDVALSPKDYAGNGPTNGMAGRTLGPCCGRVRAGEIVVDGKAYRLAANEGDNHIHGGPHGCPLQRWTGEQLAPARVRFTVDLPDGLDGYPGNRHFRADYEVDGLSLRVSYAAESDAPTWVDMTNHVYWDLSGHFDGSALDQALTLAARRVVRNGAGHLPEAIVPVEGPFDFTASRPIREAIEASPNEDQLVLGRGFNNAFLFDPALAAELGFAARLSCEATGLSMTMRTDQPSAVLYTGGFLNDGIRLAAGPDGACPGCAVALEAQGLPDPFHLEGAVPDILRPGEIWRRTIAWTFETE